LFFLCNTALSLQLLPLITNARQLHLFNYYYSSQPEAGIEIMMEQELNKRLLTYTACPSNDDSQVAQDASASLLGLPTSKRLFEPVHISAALLSMVCLLVGILAIIPDLPIAWLLQFNGQIIILGFLLGIMNLCMQTIVPHSLILLEAHFGQSRLQNYEALVTSRALSSGASLIWRLALVLLMALPLGLSIAYKRFLGGTSNRQIAVVPAGLVSVLPFSSFPQKPLPCLMHVLSSFLAMILFCSGKVR
jgi:hypothetical protein